MIQSGVDEAGKGPVLGPMVIGLVSGDPLEFKNMGVKDSKALSNVTDKAADQWLTVLVTTVVLDQWVQLHLTVYLKTNVLLDVWAEIASRSKTWKSYA